MSQAPGWYRDPFFRGHERYWDGRMWTQGTRAEGAEGAEEIIAPGDQAASAGQQPAHPGGVDPGLGAPSVPWSQEAPVPSVGQPSFAPLGAPVEPVVATPAGGPATWAPPTVGTAGSEHGGRDGRRRRAVFAIGAAALLLVAGGVSAALVLGGSGNASAEEAVAHAAAQTINAQSADMSLSMDVSVLGYHETLSGNGAFDFAHQTGTMTVTVPVNGKEYSLQEILIGSTVYVNVSGLGGLTSKPWISEDDSQIESAAGGFGTLDPASMLQRLQSLGGTVTSLGSTTYEGTAVTEYSATLPASALQGEIGQFPSSLQKSMSGVNLPNLKINIYVTSDDLLRAVQLPSVSFSDSGQSVSMDMTMDFTNYGTAVNVTPPPASEVEPLGPLGSGLGAGNTGSTGTTGSTGNTGSSV